MKDSAVSFERDIWHFALDTAGIDGGALLRYLADINGTGKNKGTSDASQI